MGLLKEFKEFAVKGNALDMAVGIIVGAAFTKIVNSIVQDIIMPPLGVAIGGVDFKNLQLVIQSADPAATPPVPEVAIRYGNFLNVVIEFLIVAFAVFIMLKVMNKVLNARLPGGIPGVGNK
jgi:large conductance mechanosensitive channel